MIAPADIVDDDHDGKPGITGVPYADATMTHYGLPGSSLSFTSPAVDKLYVVIRTESSLHGTSTSCTESRGTAEVPDLNWHVVGCQTVDGNDCDPDQWDFVDESYLPVCSGASGPGSAITGTFISKEVGGMGGGAPTCDDAIATLPSPSPQPQPQGDF
jgi:hypothetical protein